MKKKSNSKLFIKIYLIATAAAVLAVGVFLAVFYSFIGAYEASQVTCAADAYVEGFSKEELMAMAEEAVDKLNLRYEKREDYLSLLTDAYKADKISYNRHHGDSTQDRPVYSVVSDGKELVRLSLIQSGKGSFGFKTWEVEKAYIPMDGIMAGAEEYVIYAPHGGTVTVNGITVSPSVEGLDYPLESELESRNLPRCDEYSLGTLYTFPEITCTLDGEECNYFKRGGNLFYLDKTYSPANYTVNAPTGAEVTVNDVVLGESYVSESAKPYPLSPLESGKVEAPTYTVYSTGELFSSPVVSAKLNGVELKGKIDGNSCTFDYPDELKYTLSIRVPAGASVTVDGKDAGEFASAETDNAWNELFGDEITVPATAAYKITGLFSKDHEIKAYINGTPLNMKTTVDGNTVSISADHSSVINEEVSAFAMDFARAYFYYTSRGYNNTEANLYAALAYVVPGSDLYSKMVASMNGYTWTTPITTENYKVFRVDEMYRLPDGSYAVTVIFDVDQTIEHIFRSYKGTLSLHIVGEGSAMKIQGMVIVNE